jgi:hypothetical protein
VDASAAQAAGRSDVILDLHRGAVHDCQWATDRDFPSATAVTKRLTLPARRDEKEQHRAQ